MNTQYPNLKSIDTINLNSSIVSLASCAQYVGAGCLDDTVHVWKNNVEPFQKEPIFSYNQTISGVADIKFNSKSTHLASLSIDSTIKIWDLLTRALHTIEVPMFGAWRIIFVDNFLVACGDLGRMFFYDIVSREIVKKADAGDYFFTAINKNQSEKKLVLGNVNGDVYLLKTQSKDQHTLFKPHYKTIRSVTFTKDEKKLLTASDDKTLALVDLNESRVASRFEGHEDKVTCVKNHFRNENCFYSCSTDKMVMLWDCRVKNSVGDHDAGEGLWTLEPVEKCLLVGGESGTLRILN